MNGYKPILLLPAGSQLVLRGLLLRNAVLPSMQLVVSGLAVPAPLAFNLSSSGSSGAAHLVLDSCTVMTSCANFDQFAEWAAGLVPTSSADVQLVQVGFRGGAGTGGMTTPLGPRTAQ